MRYPVILSILLLFISCVKDTKPVKPVSPAVITNKIPYAESKSTNKMTINVLNFTTYQTNIILWEKTYGSLRNDEANFILPMKSGGFLIAGSSAVQSATNIDGWILRIDDNGETLWQTNYGGPAKDVFQSAVGWGDGGALLCGNTYDEETEVSRVWVLTVDDTGDTVWERKLGTGLSNSGYRALRLSNDNYVVVGYSYFRKAMSKDAYVVNLTSDGDIVWEKTYGKGDSDEAFGVCEFENNIFFSGYTGDNPLKKNRKVWIVSLDEFGNLSWQRQIGTGLTEAAYDIEYFEGAFYLFGSAGSTGAGDAWAMKLSTNGNIVWQKRYDGGGSEIALSGALSLPDRMAFTGFSYSFGKGWGDSWFVDMGPDGTVNGYSIFGGANFDLFRSVQPAGSNQYVLAGKTLSKGAGDSDAWVMKISLNRNKTNQSLTNTAALSNQTNLVVSDNPTNLITAVSNLILVTNTADVCLVLSNGITNGLDWNVTYTNHWQLSYGKDKKDSISDMILVKGQYYLCGYHTLSDGANKQGWVLTVSSNGKVLNDFQFGESKSEEFKAITTNQSGNLIAVGIKTVGTNENNNAWMMELDSNGNTIRMTNLGGSDYDAFNDVVSVSDGYMVVGETKSSGKGNTDIWVVKLDTVFNIVWEKTFGGIGNDTGYQVFRSSPTNYLIIGSYTIGSFSGSDVQTWVMKIDEAGNKIWQKYFGGSGTDIILNAVEIPGSGYLLSGQTDSYRDAGNDVWLLLINSSGESVWDQTYITGKGRVIVPVCNGLYLVGGNTGTYGNHDAWLFLTDQTGDKIWEKKFAYSNNKNNNIVAIAPIDIDSYMIVGNTSDYSDINTDVWVFEISFSNQVTFIKKD